MAAKPTRTVLFVGPAADGWVAALTTAVGRIGLPVASRAVAVTAVTADEVAAARLVVVDRAVEPAFRERFPDVTVNVWDHASGGVEQRVNGLIARLLGGKAEGPPEPVISTTPAKPAKLPVVKVSRETAGRRGKGVTVVSEVPLNEDGLKELAAKLKERCGTGGTVKDGRIEIQGDHRDRLVTELEKLGYKAKRAGG